MLCFVKNVFSSDSIFLTPIRIIFSEGKPSFIIACRNSSCVGSCCGCMQSACASKIIRNGFLCFSWKAFRSGYVIEWSPPRKIFSFSGGRFACGWWVASLVGRFACGLGLSPELANISFALLYKICSDSWMLLLSTWMCSIGVLMNCFIASGVCSGPFNPRAFILLVE